MNATILKFVNYCTTNRRLIMAFSLGLIVAHMTGDSPIAPMVAGVFLLAPFYPIFVKYVNILRQAYRGQL